MTVEELIDTLQAGIDCGEIDKTADVRMVSDYGDYWHTQQALKIQEVQVRALVKSAYSRSGEAMLDEDDNERCMFPEVPSATDVVCLM